ncbi:hypothetical protein [Emcibacter sp.]|uniref:hypothetical protein n=1 Tax=Emcibacter sp. TaxID=1979954 RepID=UPI002AA6B725|nr:hypothetical protein [Emcibacter sp.]
MLPARTSAQELRDAMMDLALLSGSLIPRNRKEKQRYAGLLSAIRQANQLSKAVLDDKSVPNDPEEMIKAFIDQGGDYRALVACLTSSTKCLEFSTLSKERKNHVEETN